MSGTPEVAVVAYHLRPGRVSLWRVGGDGGPARDAGSLVEVTRCR